MHCIYTVALLPAPVDTLAPPINTVPAGSDKVKEAIVVQVFAGRDVPVVNATAPPDPPRLSMAL
ncbi:hypothetical protein [Methylacidimicrobium cyclopophantes]|uniref:hypothetical protein n=1 Tax=Methylacidimicrobium cyclopophantes TaxID=1041766 RepID=UPI001156D1A7|nr:hypothetical protein [Methylacidimicrobium cyclopophantes]